jgi:hypothetical protein
VLLTSTFLPPEPEVAAKIGGTQLLVYLLRRYCIPESEMVHMMEALWSIGVRVARSGSRSWKHAPREFACPELARPSGSTKRFRMRSKNWKRMD